MTFKPNTSAISIAQMALGMVSESKTITSFDDPGINATVVKRWYNPVVARLLEMHHWGLATKRSALTAVTNNQSNSWTYAYAAPTDLAFPVGFTLGSGLSTMNYYKGLAGLIAMSYGKTIFQYHNGVIHSHVAGDLEYVSYNITEADFTPSFTDIVVLMLASRLALELAKDRETSADLAEQAQNAINLAITQNLNAGNKRYGLEVSERELARGSGVGSWDYIPLGPGQ